MVELRKRCDKCGRALYLVENIEMCLVCHRKVVEMYEKRKWIKTRKAYLTFLKK